MKKLIGIIALLMFAAGLPAASSIALTAPNGGETLTLGQTAHITWTASDVSQNVKLQLLTSGGVQVGVIAKDLAPASGSYTWTVGQYTGGTAVAGSYKVRVRTMDNALEDDSNAAFAIVAAPQGTLALTAPNGGESWSQGAAKTIAWTSAGLAGTNRLELWKGNARIGVIKNNLPAASGSFAWQAGHSTAGMAAAGTDYKVKVINSSGLEDAGDNFFTISKGMYQTSLNQTPGNLQPQGPPQGIAKVEPVFPKPDFVAVRLDHQQGNGLLTISIMNQGTVAFDGLLPVRVTFSHEGAIYFDDTSPLTVNLAPGETKCFEMAPVLTLKTIIVHGNTHVDVYLNPEGKISEKNEHNNHVNIYILKTVNFYIDSLEIKVEPSAWSGLMGGYPKIVSFSMTIKGVGSGSLNFKVTRLGGEKVFSQSFTLANQVSPGVWESGTHELCTIYEGDVEFYVTATVLNTDVLGHKTSNSVQCHYDE